jgi:hypothetical protein
MRHEKTLRRLALLTVLVAGLGAVAVAQEKGGGGDKIEYLRVPLYCVFHPNLESEATLQRGLYIGGMRGNSQDFKIPLDVPVGATILEVGVIAQTSNQLTVRLDRMDWAPVYAVGETAAKDAGSWSCISLVEKGLVRKVGKPVPDNEANAIPKREFEEQEFVLTVSLARNPNTTKEDKMLPIGQQRDKVTALWVKVSR